MVDYVKMAATALRLVTKYGRSVTLVKFNVTPDDAAKPWRGTAHPRQTPEATLALPAVFVDPTSISSLGFAAVVSDLLKNCEQVCLIASTEDLTGYNEILDTNGVRWKIDKMDKLAPAETTLLYYMGVSR